MSAITYNLTNHAVDVVLFWKYKNTDVDWICMLSLRLTYYNTHCYTSIYTCTMYMYIIHGGAVVKLVALRPEGRGFDPQPKPSCRDLGQVLHPLLLLCSTTALRHLVWCVCTSELCKKGNIKFQLYCMYCIVFDIFTHGSSLFSTDYLIYM